jgi:hypothetical protein
LALGAFAQTNTVVDWRYTVRPQDTVSSLARQYLKPSISWQELARYNRLPDEGLIRVGSQLRMPLPWLAVKQAQAKLTAISGDVQIQPVNGAWRLAQAGEVVQTGQQIKVGINSSARLQFADASELVMQPESLVAMDTLSVYAGGYMADTQLRLQTGRVEVHANPQGRKGQKFDVTTPAAVASVRGTQFVVDAQGGRTVQQTTEGQVALQTGQGNVVVQEGFGSAVKFGEKPIPPEVIKPAPVLLKPAGKFVDFPMVFNWVEQNEVTGWVMQVGRDPQMAQLDLTQVANRPFLDAGGLADGNYYLRAWTVDDKGLPSKTMLHPFEVAIPRQLQGPVIQLASKYVSAGPMALDLTPLAPGQRYLLQVTQDAQGRQPVWYQANAGVKLTVPQLPAQDAPYHLWIWIY